MAYAEDIRGIKEATRAAQPRWDRHDWIDRHMKAKQCSHADAREAHKMAMWLGKLEEPIT